MTAPKPHMDCRYGIWRCWVPGSRVAGFGNTPQEAWLEFWREVHLALGIAEQMGS